MVVYKTKFGEIDIPESEVITFEEGLPGFENLKKFAIISRGSEPIMWLVSLEDEKVALPVMNPWIVRVDYNVQVPKEIVEDLEIEKEEDVKVWSIVVIPQDEPLDMTINLLAPIVVNARNRKAAQIILDNPEYDIRHSVKEEMERSKKLVEEAKAQPVER